MKNTLRMLAAATAMTAVTLPAQAGYTIYEDAALPSVLFVEFDGPDQPSDAVIPAPVLSSAPVTIQGGPDAGIDNDADGRTLSDAGGNGGGGASGGGEQSFDTRMDDALRIDDARVREVIVDDLIRDEILSDFELR